MKRVRAASVPLDFDLRPVIATLNRSGYQLQVSEESGEQVVWVHDEAQIAPIQRLIEAQARGELDSQDRVAAEKGVSVAQTLVMTMWPRCFLSNMPASLGARCSMSYRCRNEPAW